MSAMTNDVLERLLVQHMKPNRHIVLCKVIDRCCLIEESDICLVIATGPQSYKSEKERTVNIIVNTGDYVVVPRKVRRITADITTDYFLVDMFDMLCKWVANNN